MNKKTDNFPEERIRWQGAKHNLPQEKTVFWEEAPEALRIECEENIDNPVLLSWHDAEKYTVVGTRIVFGKLNGMAREVGIESIRQINSTELGRRVRKGDRSLLDIVDPDGNTLQFRTEKGSEYFAVWNVILMLCRMGEKR